MKNACAHPLCGLLLSALIVLLTVTAAGAVEIVPGRLMITVAEGHDVRPEKAAGAVRTGVAGIDRLNAGFGVTDWASLHGGTTRALKSKSHRARLDRIYTVDFPAHLDVERVAAAYRAQPEVESVDFVELYRNTAFLPNDPGLGSQWHLRNMNTGGGDVRAVGGWNQTFCDTNIVVAIIDSGVDYTHPDLGGTHPDHVNGAIWTNWTEYYGSPGVDDDSNGRVDDIRGWDWVHVPGQGVPGEDDTFADNDPMDFGGHGTNCAGSVTSLMDNGVGIAALAPGAKIMALRAGWTTTDPETGDWTGVLRSDFLSAAMIYAAANGADIINCSWTSGSSLESATAAALAEGCLIVTSAGNDDTDAPTNNYLGFRAGVVAVAATNPDDGKASFSNYGSWVEVSAPGTSIYTTHFDGGTGTSTYVSTQGTSFSCPIVCGVAAMIWTEHPTWTYSQVAAELQATCDDIDAVNPGFAGLLGAGRVNVLKALGDDRHLYPDEFPTLFDAMNSAAVGDTVCTLGGETLPGPLTIPNNELLLFGGYDPGFVGRDPLGNPTVITGSVASPVVAFSPGATNATEVDGFAISGGGGNTFSGIPNSGRYGGGIVVNNASPTLRNLTVTGNSVGSGTTLGGGGGIMLNSSSAVLENVTVTGNTAVLGGGIYAHNSSLTLVDCTVENNALITDNLSYDAAGGGIYAVDTDLDLTDCTIGGHTGCESGGGIWVGANVGAPDLTMRGGRVTGNDANVNGAGIYHDGGDLDLYGVFVDANVKGSAPAFMLGGGVYAAGASALLDSLVCTGNTSQLGAAVALQNVGTASITRSLLYDNAADFYGGGLALESVAAATVASNTIVVNGAPNAGAAGVYSALSTVALDNNIIAFNTGGTSFANGVHVASGTLTPNCNDVHGHDVNWGGMTDPTGADGNIDTDPEFCDLAGQDFNVLETSPCDPANSGSCGWIGAWTEGCGTVSNVDEPTEDGAPLPTVFRVEPNVPNPFNPVTKIRFSLPREERTEVAIFDVRGRRVATLVDEVLAADDHQVEWYGRDAQGRGVAAGVYFYLVTSGEHRAVGRMALVK